MSKKYIDRDTLVIYLKSVSVPDYVIRSIENNLPVIDIEEKAEAKWDIGLSHCQCSNCKTKFRFDSSDIETYSCFKNFHYCPKCNAKMTNPYIF